MLRFRSVIAVVVAAVLMASAAVAIAAAATFAGAADARHAAVRAPRARSPKARANRRAARLDAASLLTKLNLPDGATSVGSEPTHDHGYLDPIPQLEAPAASMTAHAWWTVPGGPRSVIHAIEANPPAGATEQGRSSAGNSRTGAIELEVDYELPPITGQLGDRLVWVTVTGISGGLTGVLAESQSDWIVPRPASERIPPATRIVQISSAVPGAADGGSVAITRSAQVSSIVALLNRLPIAQRGGTFCLSLLDPKPITMTFRARAGGTALAALRFVDYRPWKFAYSSQCKPVQVSIGGRRRDALDGGEVIRRIERIIGLSIT